MNAQVESTLAEASEKRQLLEKIHIVINNIHEKCE